MRGAAFFFARLPQAIVCAGHSALSARNRVATMRNSPNKIHLTPHLQEVCTLLAAGLVQLHRHTAEDLAHDAAQVGAEAESSLHFVADQSGHANPAPWREA